MCCKIDYPTANNPVCDKECWYRVLTIPKHITRDNTVHHSAFRGRAFSSSCKKKWTHELSGRIVCMASDIIGDAEERVKRLRDRFAREGNPIWKSIELVGFACAPAKELRKEIQDGVGCEVARDVIYTPTSIDIAHSDFVTYGTTCYDDLLPVHNWLVKILRVVNPKNVGKQTPLCESWSDMDLSIHERQITAS